MSRLTSMRGSQLLSLMQRQGWSIVRRTGSHIRLQKVQDGVSRGFTFSHRESDEIGPKMMRRIVKDTGVYV